MRGNTITIGMTRGSVARASDSLYQYDYGQRLVITGVQLPQAYEVHFGNSELGQSKTVIGDGTGVDIPDEYLTTGAPIHVWVYLHEGEADGETEYHGVIGVIQRAEPTDQEPTPQQQSVIDQTIAALNAGIAEVEDIAAGIPGEIQDAFDDITAAAETLQPGSSATASFDSETKVLTIGVPRGAKGDPGDPGEPGYSPTATVTKSGRTATITIKDKSGTTSETVSDGADGYTPVRGTDYWTNEDKAEIVADAAGAVENAIIDDTAGTGETGKVWSADKSASEKSSLYESINTKQTAPASGAAAGKVLGLTEVSNELVPSWVNQPSVPVQDVQVNGVSVLNQGVANVPIGSTSNAGVLAVKESTYGLQVSENALSTSPASAANIKLANNAWRPITTTRQHESVFYGLAKAAGADMASSSNAVGTYTDAAKKAIRMMLGIYEPPYELVNDITIDSVSNIDLTATDNNIPYNFLSVFVVVTYAANLQAPSEGYGRYRFYDSDNRYVATETGRYATNSSATYKYVRFTKKNGLAIADFTRTTSTGSYAAWQIKGPANPSYITDIGNIVRIFTPNSDVEPVGTNIKIYAQWAY